MSARVANPQGADGGVATRAKPARFALGLGLTNECNLSCAFCYRDPSSVDRLSLEQVRAVVQSLPVRSVNLGTGENGLHPDFMGIVSYLRQQALQLTMTSNGYSVACLSDDQLSAFTDIEFSLDYPTLQEQDAQRGPGNWVLLHEQAARCQRLGVPVTFIAVMMRSNFDRLVAVADVAKAYGAPLRINVYQSVQSDAYALTYEEYWTAFELLFANTDVIAIGEPLVRAMAGMPPRTGGCGVATVRVTPRASVQPCVYWSGAGAPLDVLLDAGASIVDSQPFEDARSVPAACQGCAHLAACRGGCAGRRRLLGALNEPDPYCPLIRGDSRRLSVRMAPAREMPKLESACTTIVTARTS
jgi:radical SAM protein with 4Fe4S-binding SPASM domain